jgi:xylulokinase
LKGGEVGPALGAARLAQLAIDGGVARDVCLPPPVDRIVEPATCDIEQLTLKRAAFKAGYPRITPKRRILP